MWKFPKIKKFFSAWKTNTENHISEVTNRDEPTSGPKNTNVPKTASDTTISGYDDVKTLRALLKTGKTVIQNAKKAEDDFTQASANYAILKNRVHFTEVFMLGGVLVAIFGFIALAYGHLEFISVHDQNLDRITKNETELANVKTELYFLKKCIAAGSWDGCF